MSVAAYRIKFAKRDLSMNNSVIQIQQFEESTSPNLNSTLGIKPEVFRDAMQSGLSLFKSVNKFHPVTAGGSRAWEEIVATFRSSVIEECDGWHSEQQNGMPILINPEREITIVMTSGDANTGLLDTVSPKTRNAKGHVTQSYVGQNYDLFDDAPNQLTNISADTHQTWVLLYTLDKIKSEVRYELSLPTSTSISGSKGKIKICDWKTRVVFPAISFNEIFEAEPNHEFTNDSDFFDVVKK